MVKRYELYAVWDSNSWGTRESASGALVRHSDYAALERERDELKQQVQQDEITKRDMAADLVKMEREREENASLKKHELATGILNTIIESFFPDAQTHSDDSPGAHDVIHLVHELREENTALKVKEASLLHTIDARTAMYRVAQSAKSLFDKDAS